MICDPSLEQSHKDPYPLFRTVSVETVLMRGQNLHFHWEIRKNYFRIILTIPPYLELCLYKRLTQHIEENIRKDIVMLVCCITLYVHVIFQREVCDSNIILVNLEKSDVLVDSLVSHI